MLHRIRLKTSNLGLSLALLASTMVYAQVPAGVNRPAGVPEGYLITPSGYFHPSCVVRLAEGETLEAGLVLRHADGAVENVAPCIYPHYTASGEMVTAGVKPPKIGHSWIEAGNVTTTTSYGELTATWPVPAAPTAKVGQTIYLFPGLEDINDVVSIIQPVMGWNADFSSAWGIASWNCCPSGITIESAPVRVTAGDKILGTMKDNCSAGTLACSTWNVTTEDVTSGKSTMLTNTPNEGQTFNWAFAGALEVYNIAACTDYPKSGSITFSSVGLYDDNFDLVSKPGWTIGSWATGLTPQCNYGGQVGATKVQLTY
jgi:hypothetical protein